MEQWQRKNDTQSPSPHTVCIFHPINKFDYEPFYVGKGTNNRDTQSKNRCVKLKIDSLNEIVIGKLVLAKEFLTMNHHKMIDEVIETLAAEYTDRRTSGELDN